MFKYNKSEIARERSIFDDMGFLGDAEKMEKAKWMSKVRDKPRRTDDEMIQYTIIAHADMDGGAS